ncbi:hypothetical protein C8C83_4691 [Flavobacterium sp. 90]|uniref:hypothetical protein n=1 Tax=unclassified Flavobacterium TaxID=196869 RepID=UPI000EB26ED0|nr:MULTISPECIES: hypothetical protein [unclassified Flavobacterium]RKR05346.1 hypothetical protein C8C82_5034 [Flavobacterium sp. 81]TCK56660.1 hypothetical protein C8C83_4691 [Flavobacterium sp. 90]
MRKITFTFLIIILYSFTNNKEVLSFGKTDFSETCVNLAHELRKNGHGKLISKSDGKYIEAANFGKILLSISKYDLNSKEIYEIEKVESGKLSKLTWEIKNSQNIKSIEKVIFKTNLIQDITIIDYTIYRKVKPNYIHLRVVQNAFEELNIDKVKYHSFFEERLIGADEAIEELNEIEK